VDSSPPKKRPKAKTYGNKVQPPLRSNIERLLRKGGRQLRVGNRDFDDPEQQLSGAEETKSVPRAIPPLTILRQERWGEGVVSRVYRAVFNGVVFSFGLIIGIMVAYQLPFIFTLVALGVAAIFTGSIMFLEDD
jgi:hypothetical protein